MVHKPLFSGVKVVFMRVPPLHPNKLMACFVKKTQSCAYLSGRRVNSLLLLGLLIPESEPVALFVEKHPVLAPSPAFVYRPPSGYPIDLLPNSKISVLVLVIN
ncbi:hypothetical protein RINTU1_32890 [Candidatus Regiella insecticola]|uniref:Uncharacterized protein n=1 Tax=Candidatus Regiella insecticola TaxID=138073 RepID=A0A6L2ZSG0_9ENTR|nr:hypothetical protein RINTU1_32890 [Candidatus Regiella insecticola]